MSQTQSQTDLDLTTLDSARSTYNAALMVKNNEEPDEGVLEILQLLHDDPFDYKRARQKINKGTVRKLSVSATIALITGVSRDDAWRSHNKTGLPILKDLLASCYGNNLPQQCEDCTLVYECSEADLCKCVACKFAFCPAWCPSDGGDSRYFHPICSPCLQGIGASSAPSAPTPTPSAPALLPGSRDQSPGPGSGEATVTDTPEDPTPTPAAESSPGSPRALGGGKPPSQPPGGPGRTPNVSPKNTDKVSEKVCGFYSKSCCKFGSKGEGCSYSHPNKCFKWMKRGTAGCSKGAECDYFHVKLCKAAAKGAECNNEKCTLPHVSKLTSTQPGPRVPRSRGENPNVITRTPKRDSNTFAKAKALIEKPPQVFQIRRTPEAPDMTVIKGLLEAVALLTKQMGEMMERLRSPVPGPQIPALYSHPPPPIQAQHQPLYQAYPYHQHLQHQAVVRNPSSQLQ
jgi:hypothetical protein